MDLELEPLYVPDENPFSVDEEIGPDSGNYTGSERRLCERRCGHDRRGEVRFEPGREDRRAGKDRRKGNISWNDFYT